MELSLVSLNSDPSLVKSFLGKSFEVHTIDNEIHRGNLYVMDPESQNLVLSNKTENTLKLINGDALKVLYVLDDCGEDVEVFEEFDEAEMKLQRSRIKDWLKLNLIEVNEVGDQLKFEDHLIIEKPYSFENIYCENTIVLDRFRKLIAKMPKK